MIHRPTNAVRGRASLARVALLSALAIVGLGSAACGSGESSPPATGDSRLVWSAGSGATVSSSAPAVASSAPVAVASASASASAVASSSASAAPVASSGHVPDPQNKSKPPLSSDALTDAGKRLFEAIKADDPKIAADFFFPREPFIPLKDIKNPGKYWDQLFRTYERDIHDLNRKRGKEMANATFESFELGSAPTWVPPGDEANKIGYFRTFNSKLHYKVDGKTHTLEVKVIISWDEHWYITHLLPWKK
ncbi:MAG: hypothetical protein U0165_16040 [Polyangiaceae bacterium]